MSRVAIRNATLVALVSEASEFIQGEVLDAGCGAMPYKRIWHHKSLYRPPVSSWTGLDLRPVADYQGDIRSMPFDDETFDTVLCTDVLQYVLDPQAAITEMARVLNPGGHLIVACPNSFPEDGTAFFDLKLKGLGAMSEQAGLTEVYLGAGGEGFSTELIHLATSEKWGVPISGELKGWVDMLDKEYPLMNLLIARK